MDLDSAKLTGVVLAGGRGRRMGGQDKGLVAFCGRPMVTYALASLQGLAGNILISANRNVEVYQTFGYPIVEDQSGNFQGPLMGLFSTMQVATTPYLMTIPCDSPFLTSVELRQIMEQFKDERYDVCVPIDGARSHPVVMLAKRSLVNDLGEFLAEGGRKVELWLARHRLQHVDFSDCPQIFTNINALDDLVRYVDGTTCPESS